MHFLSIMIVALLHTTTVVSLPLYLGISRHELTFRGPTLGGGTVIPRARGSARQQAKVQGAADNFAGDVAIVSSSLNGLGMTTDAKMVKQLATKAFIAEKDEDQHRAILFNAAGKTNAATAANKKIVDNTPIVLNGLQSIMNNPSPKNTMRSLQKMETARLAGDISCPNSSSTAFD